MSVRPNPVHDNTVEPPRPRRWIPASLKAFAAIQAAVLIVGVTWVSVRHHQTRDTLDAIKRLGGNCELRAGGPGWLRKCVGDQWLLGFDEITSINLGNTPTT